MPRYDGFLKSLGMGLLAGAVVMYVITIVLFGLGLVSSFGLTKGWYLIAIMGAIPGGLSAALLTLTRVRPPMLIGVMAAVALFGLGVYTHYLSQHGTFLDRSSAVAYLTRAGIELAIGVALIAVVVSAVVKKPQRR